MIGNSISDWLIRLNRLRSSVIFRLQQYGAGKLLLHFSFKFLAAQHESDMLMKDRISALQTHKS
jgi:hypothetical protein